MISLTRTDLLFMTLFFMWHMPVFRQWKQRYKYFFNFQNLFNFFRHKFKYFLTIFEV